MSSAANSFGNAERGLSPADLQQVRFSRASMLHPGYVDTEVDRVVHRAAEELARHIGEKAQLREQVRTLQAQLNGVPAHEPPSEQAVRILASAQQTADNYVAEAEQFSRQVTGEARAEYEEAVRLARENAGAIIQAAQEAAARLTGPAPAGPDRGGRSVAELEEQVAYLKAFGQACRTQLRSYLEALLSDVESEWGRADPAALPTAVRPPAQRAAPEGGPDRSTTFEANTTAEDPPAGGPADGVTAGTSARPAS
ncbi:DivIVA domain-containing protein [Blastococcus saxobsidens]|uniref:Cell wall synthesis protein Wag31 n=1 Tax=Blastococcus saxobsidens TaxID=138336 RepID=A0A4Q7Y4Q6_9ACTN|nr:DivIVA domain-containing protein [Blastococcus saxobsidens]RZU31852.1 DivIVA domain-containing protein [Blastococcus saxobsidens]